MLNSRVFLAKGAAFLAFVYLAFLSSNLSAATNPDQLWNDSLLSLQRNDPKTACKSLEEWVQSQLTQNIKSAEAYFNLGLCYWKLKSPSESVFWTVQSLNLRNSVLKRFSDIKLLQAIQKEIGIREHLAAKTSFILRMIFPNWLAPGLGILGGWSIIIYYLFFRKRSKVGFIFLTLTATTWTLSGLILLVSSVGGPIAVISSNEPSPLFTFDKLGKSMELASLPSGMLIELGPTKDTNVQVLKPVGGWVKQEAIKVILPDS